jgi:cytochrome c556
MTVSLFINFVTVPMVKNIIESKATEETRSAMLKFEAEAKKYLNYLERSRLKAKTSADGCSSAVNANTEEYEK